MKTLQEEWLLRYFRLAVHVSSWSKDPSTKVGAVLVGADRTMICHGYNGFPAGLADDPAKLLDRDYKYARTQHAERNALDNARFDVAGGILAVTMFPCSNCAKSIISRKIKTIVSPMPTQREPWLSDAAVSTDMLQEAGVWWHNAADLDSDKIEF